jgi:hypothetical protein
MRGDKNDRESWIAGCRKSGGRLHGFDAESGASLSTYRWSENPRAGHIGLALAESQIAAIRLALASKVLVMTGGPGVGKTTIVKGILRILAAKGTNLLLCAPPRPRRAPRIPTSPHVASARPKTLRR